MQSALAREYRKMYRNLNGIRTLNRLPECLVVIDPLKEKNAIKEARALGITTVALIDTDCDPDSVDLVDSRQRRRHPLDRADHAAPGRGDPGRLAKRRRREAEGQGRRRRPTRASWSAPARPRRRMETSKAAVREYAGVRV